MEGNRSCSRRPPDCYPDPCREVRRRPQGHFPPVRLLLGGLQEVLLVSLCRVILHWVVLHQVVLRRVVLHHGLCPGFRLGPYLVPFLGLFLVLLLGLLLHCHHLGLVDPVALWGFIQGVWRNAKMVFLAIVRCMWVESFLGSSV